MADNVKLVLEFDSTGAIQNVKNFGSSLKKEVDDSSSAFDGLSSKLKMVGAAVAAYFTVGAVKDFFGAIVSESMDAEEQLNQLNGALKRAGTYSQQSSQQMQDFASSMMNLTTIDDDVIVGQLAIARNFTKTDEEARKLVKAAGDLSAAMGVDLGTATELLGRTLDGTAGRLNETVPALRNVSAEALKAGAAIDIVGKAFEGAAANKVNTFEGSLARLGNAFGNLKAAMGDVIVKNPMIIAAINEISNLFVYFTDKVTGSKDGMTSWINNGILAMINAIRAVFPYLNEFISWLKSLAAILTILKEGFMGALDSIVLLASGIGKIIEKFTGGQKSAYLFAATLDDMSKRADKMKEALMGIGKDAFSQKEMEAFLAGLDRISAAAGKGIKVDVEANLDTSKLKSDLNAKFNLDIKPDKYTAPEPGAPIGDLMGGRNLGDDVEIILSPIKWAVQSFMEVTTDIISQSIDIIKSQSPVMYQVISSFAEPLGDLAYGFSGIATQIVDDIDSNSSAIFKAWDDAIGNGEGVFKASLDSFQVAFKSVDWNMIGAIASDALINLGNAALTLSKNLSAATISGAVAASGQAVQSTIGNIGKGEAGAKTAVVDTLGAIGTAFDKALGTGNAIGDALKSFLNTLSNPENLSALINGFINAIPKIIDSFIQNIPILIDGIVRALPVLLDGIIKMIPEIMSAFAQAIGPILKTLAEKFPDIIIAIAENIDVIVEALADAMPTVITKLIAAMPRVATALVKSFFTVLWTMVTEMLPAIVEGVLTGISKALSNIGSGAKLGGTNSAKESLKETFSMEKLQNAIDKAGNYLWEKTFAAMNKIFFQIPEQIGNAIKPVIKFFAELDKKIFEQGIMPIINFFATVWQFIWEQGLKPLTDFFATVWQFIWEQGLKPLTEFFGNLWSTIWNDGILKMVNWFADLGSAIWNNGIMPLVNWFASLPAKLWDAIQGGFKSLTGGGKSGPKLGISIGGKKYASGGVVPAGYPNDTYPALLTSGETVLPADKASTLFNAIDSLKNGGGSNGSEVAGLLRQLIALIASQETTVNVQLDRNTLAKAILTLNKDNRRLA